MKERIFEDPTSLANQLTTVDKIPSGKKYHSIGLSDVQFTINLSDSDINSFFEILIEKDVLEIEFLNCKFEITLWMNKSKNKTIFENANFIFSRCSFQNLVLADFNYKGKFQFNFCCFEKKQYFHHATFKNDIEFFNCEFNNVVIFYKVQFEKNINLTSSTFHENLLFSYSKFLGLGIFNRVIFKKGLDLSLTSINNNLTFFETKINNYHSEKIDIHEERHFETGNSRKRYDISVTGSGNIPTLNKRETFRIIKHQLEKEGNNIDAFKYNSLEKQAYQQQLKEQGQKWFNSQDALMFAFNSLSNNHKISWFKGVVFTFCAAILFYSLSIFSSGKFILSLENFSETFNNNLKAIVVFLNPVHNPNYITDIFNIKSSELNGWYYALDFVGRIFIGYGIYQTIQAFRKFR